MRWIKTTNETLINTRYIRQFRIASVTSENHVILAELYLNAAQENFYIKEFKTKKEASAYLNNLLEQLNNDKETTS